MPTLYDAWVEANKPLPVYSIPGDKVIAVARACGAVIEKGHSWTLIHMRQDYAFLYVPDDIQAVDIMWSGPMVNGREATWLPNIAQRRDNTDALNQLEIAMLAKLGCSPSITKTMPASTIVMPNPPWLANGVAIVMFTYEARVAAVNYMRTLVEITDAKDGQP